MTDEAQLCASIADMVRDYRAGEVEPPTAEHVARWAGQFPAASREALLSELKHVLDNTYISKHDVDEFLDGLVRSNKVAGPNPCDYWRSATFLRIQQGGHSQSELLSLFDQVLMSECGFDTTEAGPPSGIYIYVDDAIFSGTRLATDVQAWLHTVDSDKIDLHVIVIASHTGADYYLDSKRIPQIAQQHGKQLRLTIWRLKTFENRKFKSRNSQVFWPASLPDDPHVRAYLDLPHAYPFEPRAVGGTSWPFSCEQGRHLMEQSLLLAGVHIVGLSQNPAPILRPLGLSPFGVGFGSPLVTFRNCPNNAPLAFWWGDPDAPSWHPFSRWYPLFPRKTYGTRDGC